MKGKRAGMRDFLIVDLGDASNWAAIIISIGLLTFAAWMFLR